MERVSSGVPGLDVLLGGGFLKNSVNLIAGTPGSGKTILAVQFLTKGAELGEKGLYISLEENSQQIINNVQNLGIPLTAYLEKGLLVFKQFKLSPVEYEQLDPRISPSLAKMTPPKPPTIMDLYFTIKDSLSSENYSRLVIDSLSVLKLSSVDESQTRVEIAALFQYLKRQGLTSIIISEKSKQEEEFSFEDFLADSLILMRDYLSREERKRGITVLKQRGANCDRSIRPYVISSKGISIYPQERLF
ncbi:MAG: ATPase domain-containing protein [archaeon]